jgi:hypothetical protein
MSLWKVPDLPTAVLMERFYDNLLQRRLPRAEALREARFHVRNITVGQLRAAWLSPQTIRRLSAGDPEVEDELRALAQRPDGDRPFAEPFYWGAFICQGDPGPLGVRQVETPATVPPTAEPAQAGQSSGGICSARRHDASSKSDHPGPGTDRQRDSSPRAG